MIPTIIELLKLMLCHQIELSNAIDELKNKGLPEAYVEVTRNDLSKMSEILLLLEESMKTVPTMNMLNQKIYREI